MIDKNKLVKSLTKEKKYMGKIVKTKNIRINLKRKVVNRSNKVFIEPKFDVMVSEDLDDIDVSIIIPMYNSGEVIADQIAKWNLEDDGLKKEIIYVDDKCPQHSYVKVINAWKKRKQKFIGKIVKNQSNGGFGFSCNVGAQLAKGKYLIFLNADTIVTSNWIKPILDVFETHSDAGIVGNLQLKGNEIHSAGSEWRWKSKSFEHIGRHTYQGKSISKPFSIENIPDDLMKIAEREMVTGCCFAIPKKLFIDMQGFDLSFIKGYWEDSDLNLRVRERGYKVYYTPFSKIYHTGGHSKGSQFSHHNRGVFESKWVKTGKLTDFINEKRNLEVNPKYQDNKTSRIIGCVNLNLKNKYFENNMKVMKDFVDEWIFITNENIDIDCKHKIIKNTFTDLDEIKNSVCKYLTNEDWFFWIDEFDLFIPEHLWQILFFMKNYDCIVPQQWMFWKNENLIVDWKSKEEKIVKWKKTYSFKDNRIINKDGCKISELYNTYKGSYKLGYNYGWTNLDKVRFNLKLLNCDETEYLNNIYYNDKILYTHPLGYGECKSFEGISPLES